jgi:HopA1 effector protein family
VSDAGRYRATVIAALEALRIESPTGFSWCGEPSPPLAPEMSAAMPAETARAYLADQLQGCLYESFYCSGGPVPRGARQRRRRGHRPGPSPFVDELSRANRGRGSREPGWTVVRTEDDGRIVVRRGGLSLWARPEEVSGGPGDDGGAEPGRAEGAEISVALPSELRRLSPGFYMALGDVGLDLGEPLVRHYWNLESAGGAALIAAGTGVLNQAGVPFRLKVAIEPASYDRCDAGVLYTPRRGLATVAALLPTIRGAVAAHLRPGAPALTKPLAEGLAVADDPPGGDSFGLHRCGLLADGAIAAFERGIATGPERLAAVEAHFEEAGVSFERPYLNADSADEFELVA